MTSSVEPGGGEEKELGMRRDVRFPETRWSLISGVRDADDAARERALAELCRLYWYPVYAFARSRGCNPEHSEDLTQDLFLKFLRKESFGSAMKEKGKLRTYLLTSMAHLMANSARRAARLEAGSSPVSIERDGAEARLAREEAWTTSVTPDQQFDRRWAEAMLQQVEQRLAEEHEAAGKADQYATLKQFIAGDGTGASYAQIAQSLSMTEGAVKVAVHRLRKRFRMVLRDEIAQTVVDEKDVEAELRHLYVVLSRR